MQQRNGDFLIYGGLVLDGARAEGLSGEIDRVRERRRVPRDYQLKFNPGPHGFENSQFIDLKQAVLEAAYNHGARLLAYVVLHDIARSPDEARRNGINTVCFNFHCVLNRVRQPGLVLIDRFNDEGNQIDAHLRRKFTVGTEGMPFGSEMRLPNIVGFHYSTIGQAHFPSVVDVALGSLRFAVNAHTRRMAEQAATARRLLELLGPLFWREEGDEAVSEIGFTFSPKAVQRSSFRRRYQSLKDYMGEAGVQLRQEITDQRPY